MKKFTINCNFDEQVAPFTIYIGTPEQSHHPLHFQAEWLTKQRGGVIPAEVMEAVAKLKELAEKNNTSLEELCVYALASSVEEEGSSEEDINDQHAEAERSDEERNNG